MPLEHGSTASPRGFALCQDGLNILGVIFWRGSSTQKNWDIAFRKLQARPESWAKETSPFQEG